MNIKLNKDLIVFEEDEEILLINMKENTFHSLDSISSIIWNKIEEYKQVDDVINFISENSDGEKGIIRKDITEFIYNLEKVGVIEIDEKV
ncbi:PqqD family protein [Bacillus cereus]|uniref:PqqD family protein n=1 Tax=Bacillus TaxID=1386 RepID=UPI0005CF4E2B|nr:PqqD family protein [Bacillus cereus]MDR4154447.1 PqqD family protein [Bacillus cereus]MEB9955791.1 PqqD family protein [Bacillus cereus]HDR4911448.1 PqqD family protein [Bacillus cereus]HDR4915575.1 PqqD family protein [Bacillus cereus]